MCFRTSTGGFIGAIIFLSIGSCMSLLAIYVVFHCHLYDHVLLIVLPQIFTVFLIIRRKDFFSKATISGENVIVSVGRHAWFESSLSNLVFVYYFWSGSIDSARAVRWVCISDSPIPERYISNTIWMPNNNKLKGKGFYIEIYNMQIAKEISKLFPRL